MKSILWALIGSALVQPLTSSSSAAEYFAEQVISYTAGAGVGSYTDPAAALGKPSGFVGKGTFNPFSPHFSTSELARIGAGGELTLQLSHFVTVDLTPGVREIGIWENVGLVSASEAATNPATVFGADSALVSVSADGVDWFTLDGDAEAAGLQPIVFTLPGNYYANATGINAAPPAEPVLADFGQPFTGTLASFDGKSFSEILATLGGTAGGTWLDLDSTGLKQVGYVRFSGVGEGQTLEINGVGINGSLAAAPVPEPGAMGLLGVGMLGFVARRRRRAAALSCAAMLCILAPGSADAAVVQSMDDVQFWVGTGENRSVILIDWNDGKPAGANAQGETLAWGIRWSGSAAPTTYDALLAIDGADSRLQISFGNFQGFGAFVFGIGYDLDNDGGAFRFSPSGQQSGSADDADDHIAFGSDPQQTNGFWSFLNGKIMGNTIPPSSTEGWEESQVGVSGRTLANGVWDAVVFSDYAANPNFAVLPPSIAVAAAVPEPSTAALLLGAVGLIASRRRRR